MTNVIYPVKLTFVYTRKISLPTKSCILLGPRGTGKSSLLQAQYGGHKNTVFYDLLNPYEFLRLQRNPELFRNELSALVGETTIIIDEIQKMPIFLDDVQHFLVNNKKIKFILTGSSARKLKKQSANLLAGRLAYRQMFPLVYSEYGEDISTEEALTFGLLPEVVTSKKKEDKLDFLESYATLYLKEEVIQEGAAKNLDSFMRFLDVAALLNGQLLSVSGLSRDSGVGRTTINGYFNVLEDTLIGAWLESWRPKIRIKEVEHPKFYFFDTGVVRALGGKLRKPVSDEEKGFLLETYILHELKAFKAYQRKDFDIFFWKTPSKTEIDFVLDLGHEKIGIEIKSSKVWKKEFSKNLKTLMNEKQLSRAIGVYMGDRPLKDEMVEVYPVKVFLKKLYANFFI